MKKNKALLLIAYSLQLTALLVGCAKQEIKNIDSKGKNIICIGDSLTFGYGVKPEENYPSALSKIIDIPVINAGIDGDTSAGGLRRIESDVLDNGPLIVIIEFGGNDFLRRIPLEETISNIEQMVDKIHQRGAIAAIADIHFGLVMPGYGEAMRKLAKKKDAAFIPSILNGILTNPDLKSDYIHPNAQGYSVMAQRIYRVIRPILNRNRLLRQSGTF